MPDYEWPTGVTTATLSVSPPRAALGATAQLTVSVKPNLGGARRLVWGATGETFTRLTQTLTGFGAMEFDLPHVDQAGWVDGDGNAVTLWAYDVTVTASYGGRQTSWQHSVQPLVGTTDIDLDSLPDGQPLTPVNETYNSLLAYVTQTEGYRDEAEAAAGVAEQHELAAEDAAVQAEAAAAAAVAPTDDQVAALIADPASDTATGLSAAIADGAAKETRARSGAALIDPTHLSVSHAAPITTPTYDGSGQAVHPSVLYLPEPWGAGGYRWWMAMTPYPNYNEAFENPSILASHDGITWEVPAGLTNPIFAPQAGFAPDPQLLMVDDVMYCVYGVKSVQSSTDGVTWTAKENMVGTFASDGVASTVARDAAGLYHLWYVDKSSGAGVAHTLAHKTATSILGPWSADETCTVTGTPTGRNVWHVSVIRVGDGWLGCFAVTDAGTATNSALHFAYSDDGVTWTMPTTPNLAPELGTSFDSAVYASALVPTTGRDGAQFWCYYSGVNTAGVWRIARTPVTASRTVADKASVATVNRYTAGQMVTGAARNIHPNPTLMVGAVSSALVPTGYSNNLVGATGHTWNEDEQAHEWSHNTSGGGNMELPLIPAAGTLVEGESWCWSYEGKLDAAMGRLTVGLLWRDASGTAIGTTTVGSQVTRQVGRYVRIAMTSVVPANAARVSLYQSFTRENTGAVKVSWRKAQFEKGTTPTAWTPGAAAIHRAAKGQVQNIEEWHGHLDAGRGARVGFAVAPSGRPLLPSLSSAPTDAAVVGELAVVSGKLYVCTAAGTPGTWTIVGTQT